jgi:hypothetical protein
MVHILLLLFFMDVMINLVFLILLAIILKQGHHGDSGRYPLHCRW